MGATMKDVARAAGVSASTVCRALTSPDLVRPATRELVRRVADQLGYQPNRAARGLITGRTGNVGLVVPDLTNPFFPGVVKGVQTRARESDYQIFLADADEDVAAETGLVRALSRQVDGMVLCSPRMSEENLRAVAAETPMVMLNRRVTRIPSVNADNLGGVRQAVAHLSAFGHRRIAYVAGPRMSWSHRERVRGLREATARAGVELVEMGHVVPHFDGGVAAADLVLATGATAVIAYNDLVAFGLLSRLHARGVRVPESISVIGFDDIALSTMVHPSLTTVYQPQEPIGKAGMDLLLWLMDRQLTSGASRPEGDKAGVPRREMVTQLMVRGSTGPAPPRTA